MTLSPMRAIVLTDDEVAAIVLRLGVDWASPLPSLANSGEGDLEFAAVRGWRSLSVRHLVAAGQLDPGLSELLNPAFQQSIFARTFPASADGVVPLLGTFLTAYRAAGTDLLVEVISGNGIHAFELQPIERVRQLISSALAAAFVDGITVPDGWPSEAAIPNSLCAVSNVSGRNLALIAARGSTRLVQVVGETDTELGVDVSIHDVVAQMLCQDEHPTERTAGSRV